MRTWYSHAAQRSLEEQMTQEDLNAQKSRIRMPKRPRQSESQLEVSFGKFLICMDTDAVAQLDLLE